MDIVLRVQGEQLDLDRYLHGIPESNLEAKWRVGAKRIDGSVHTTSGFNLLLSEGEPRMRAVEQAASALSRVAPRVAELIDAGATVEVDCGLMVTGDSSQSVEFGPEFIGMLHQSGVSLVVSAYPCSDSDD